MTSQQTALITGGTGDLGYQTAKAIAEAGQGWLVVITGRDHSKVVETAHALRLATGAEVIGMPLDLSSLADVRRFATQFTARTLPPLRAVICNAGIQIVSGTRLSEDGFELTFAVNHLAHFLLVQELLAHLVAPGRIVMVASDTHDPTKRTGMPAPVYASAGALAHPADTGQENASLVGRRRYTTSKLCNVLMTYELFRRLGGAPGTDVPGVTVNAFDPGLMPGTGLARDYAGFQAFAWRYVLPIFTVVPGLNIHTPHRSAHALARLITDPALAGTTGKYFSGMREIRSSADSYDVGQATELWETSEWLIEQPVTQKLGSKQPSPWSILTGVHVGWSTVSGRVRRVRACPAC